MPVYVFMTCTIKVNDYGAVTFWSFGLSFQNWMSVSLTFTHEDMLFLQQIINIFNNYICLKQLFLDG